MSFEQAGRAHPNIFPSQMQRSTGVQSKSWGLLAQTCHDQDKQTPIQASKKLVCFISLPFHHYLKSSSQDAFQISSKDFNSCFFPSDHEHSNFYSVSSRYYDIIFPFLLPAPRWTYHQAHWSAFTARMWEIHLSLSAGRNWSETWKAGWQPKGKKKLVRKLEGKTYLRQSR